MRAFLGLSTLLFTLVSLGMPVVAAEPERRIEITNDADYFGFDLRTEQNVSLDQCKSACIADRSCRAFTYNPKVKWCFLKSDFKQLNTFPGGHRRQGRRNRRGRSRHRGTAAPRFRLG